MKHATLLLALAACGGGTQMIGNSGGGAADVDRAMTFVPGTAGKDALAKREIPFDKAKDLVATVPEDGRGDFGRHDDSGDGEPNPDQAKPHAYDLDGDGRADLVEFPEIMFGPSQGWIVYMRDGDKLKRAFGLSGGWADLREAGPIVAVRYEVMIIDPSEALFSTTLRYDKAAHAWGPPLKAYVAQQGKRIAAPGKLVAFETAGAATLRHSPAVDDAPKKEDDAGMGAEGQTATLRGNVVATYGAKARGVIVGSEGDWRYVAFDPATKPTETSLGHGMDEEGGEAKASAEDDAARHKLYSTVWLVGWVRSSEIH